MSKEITTGLKRNNNEQYYTKSYIAEDCIHNLANIYDLNDFECVIEPSAGTGVFLKNLQKYNIKNVLSYDIDPKESTIKKQDYLQTKIDKGNILVIGNPPFGRQSSLAKKFIKHSCLFARVIGFILPRSFKKESMTNVFSDFFHKVFEKDLELNSFIYEEKEYGVPCVFQIWEKREYIRQKKEKLKENDTYIFVKKNENPNIAFRRVGGNAGKFFFDEFEKLSSESHYFIKKQNINEMFCKKIQEIKWNDNNTTGPKSISKQELIEEFNKINN